MRKKQTRKPDPPKIMDRTVKSALEGKPHPLYIPSIVNQVMSYLSTPDLLRARQVCRQWNEEASKYFRGRVKLKIYRSFEVKEVHNVIQQSKMFRIPLEFSQVHLEAHLTPRPAGAFSLFFTEIAPKLKSLSLKQSWDRAFPLNQFPRLEELTLYGNLNKQIGIFPVDGESCLPNLKRAFFYLEGRITTTTALETFAVNISTLIRTAPNLEEIIAPQKLDHRDETPESFRDDSANHIFLHLLASDRSMQLPQLRVIQIDAKLIDLDLRLLGMAAGKFPNVDTLRIALNVAATRSELVFVLKSYAKTLKNLSISYSKTHGHRMTLESFFLEENPLTKLENLSLKNYPASAVFVGAIRSLQEFKIEVRNIAECFPTDRDDFFLQPAPSTVVISPSKGQSESNHSWCSSSSSSVSAGGSQGDESQPAAAKKIRNLNVDPSKVHGLAAFHYIHHKEGTQINLYGDRCPYTVTRRIAMRFPQLTRLTLDNMTGESLTCVIKYLPLLEELTALGGFYDDLAVTGANCRTQLEAPDFPARRKLPYIGDLKYLHTLTLSTFGDNGDLLSPYSVYYGLLDCRSLRRLTLGNDQRKISSNVKFETNIGDRPLLDLIKSLNLVYLKTVRCPITTEGFQKILKKLRQQGVEYSINTYEGPLLPEEFFRRNRKAKPVVKLKRLVIRINKCGSNRLNSKEANKTKLNCKEGRSGPPEKKRRKRRYGRY